MKNFLFKCQIILVTVFFPLTVLFDIIFWNLFFGSWFGFVSPKNSWKELAKNLKEDQIKCGFRKGDE